MKLFCSVLAFVAGGAPALAQTGFDALYEKAMAVPRADAAARRQAFAAAYRAFAGLPASSVAYRNALPRGARSAFYSGAHRAAVSLFGGLLAAGRADDRCIALLLTSLVRSGQGRRAAETAKSVKAKYPGGVRDWSADLHDFGRLAALGGELLRGADPLGLWLFELQDRALRDRPGREFALANLALAYRQLGRPAASRAAYRQALKLTPGDGTLWSDYGLLLKGLGEVDEAFAAFVAAKQTETVPGSSPAGTNLGVLFQRTGARRGRDPRKDLLEVLAQRPSQSLARRVLLDGLADEAAGSKDRKPR